MTRAFLVAGWSLLAACGHDGDPQVLLPDDLQVTWDATFDRSDDGLASFVPIDVMVYAGGSGEPLEGAVLSVRASGGAGLLRPEAVLAAGEGPSDAVWWDAWRDRSVSLPGEAPTAALDVETDATGLARFYVFVDRFPSDENGVFVPARVDVVLGDVEESFLLVPR